MSDTLAEGKPVNQLLASFAVAPIDYQLFVLCNDYLTPLLFLTVIVRYNLPQSAASNQLTSTQK